MGKALVIGSTGLLGGAVLRCLSRSFPLVALRHRNTPADGAADVRDGDLLDPRSLRCCLDGVGTILFFPSFSTPLHSPLDPRHEMDTTVAALTNLLEAAAAIGAHPHVVFASTAGAMYGERADACGEETAPGPVSSYGLGKLISENVLEFYSRVGRTSHTILRFSNLYGSPGRRMVKQGAIDVYLDDALAGDVSTVWTSPASTRDYLHADDAARAIEAVLRAPDAARNVTFNVSSGVTTSMADVLATVARVTEGRHRYRMENAASGGPTHTRIDPSRFRAAFGGWPAPIRLEEGIALAWRRKLAHREDAPLSPWIDGTPARIPA